MKQKSLRTIATELGVSPSYLSQVMRGKRPASEKVCLTLERHLSVNVKQSVKQLVGGRDYTYQPLNRGWRERMGVEPTRDILVSPNGFEVREAHRDSSAPS